MHRQQAEIRWWGRWIALVMALVGGALVATPGLANTPNVAPPVEQPKVPPGAPSLRQVTQGGCCTQFSWSGDGRQLLFIDKPSPQSPVGIWGVDVAPGTAGPRLITDNLGPYSPGMVYRVEQVRNTTTLVRMADGLRWRVPSEGRSVVFSPSMNWIAWQASGQTSEVWVAAVDGSKARRVTSTYRGNIYGWLSDDALLLSRRLSAQSRVQVLYAYTISTGAIVELVRSDRLSGVTIAPGGNWLAYTVMLSRDTAQNGLWVVRRDGTGRKKVDDGLFGAYQWRADGRLLLLPLSVQGASHVLWELQAESGVATRLTDPAVTPFKVAQGDWRVAPDGKSIAFLHSGDHNIWLLTLE